jgi:dienelactone hydrolase
MMAGMAAGARTRRAVARLLVAAAVLAVLATAYTGYAAWRHRDPVALPAATGSYAVGRVRYEWADTSRTDPLAPRAGQPRELPVWLWYPAKPGAGTGRAQAGHAAYAPGLWRDVHLPAPVGLGETDFRVVRTHSWEGADAAGGRFPVVVLEPGLGFSALQYTTLAEDLASHGYVVAGVTETYSSNHAVLHGRDVTATQSGNPSDFAGTHMPASQAVGDRLVGIWSADARFVARRAADLADGPVGGHVDGERVVYVGHSFGGATALQACADDPRCRGAVDLDGGEFGDVVDRGLSVPLMVVTHDGGECITGRCTPGDAADRADQRVARQLVDHHGTRAWLLTLAGTEHFNFSDYGAYQLAAPLRLLLAVGSADGRQALDDTDGYVSAFVDHVTGRGTSPLLDGTRSIPGVRLLAHP